MHRLLLRNSSIGNQGKSRNQSKDWPNPCSGLRHGKDAHTSLSSFFLLQSLLCTTLHCRRPWKYQTQPAKTSPPLPFPDNVPTAPMLRISLKRLPNNDQDESSLFFTAYKDLGFFLPRPRWHRPRSIHILEDADKLFHVGKQLDDLPVEEKQKYDFSAQKSYFG